ncbi:MAG TPA: hypothetical protein VFW66_03500 [Gemmatimonadales bacterium]|nr:hypothetical protein [Gemmatimonadales bacterium]
MTHADTTARQPISDWMLWITLMGVPLLWSIQALVDTAIIGHACFPRSMPLSQPAPGAWTAALIITLILLALAIVITVYAVRNWRRIGAEQAHRGSTVQAQQEGRVPFMAFSGVLFSVLFLYGIVMNGLSLFLVSACG